MENQELTRTKQLEAELKQVTEDKNYWYDKYQAEKKKFGLFREMVKGVVVLVEMDEK